MPRWGLEAITFVAAVVVGLLVLAIAGVRPDTLFDFAGSDDSTALEPLTGSATTVPATTVPPVAYTVPPTTIAAEIREAAALCVEHTKTFAFIGDQEALDLWRYLGESDEQLEIACRQFARQDSRAVDVWRWELAVLRNGSTPPSTSISPAFG